MKINVNSDLSRVSMLQKMALSTRNALDRAGVEMSSGVQSSPFKATGGNLTRLFSVERMIDRNAVFQQNLSLTEMRVDVMQNTLGLIQAPLETLGAELTAATGRTDLGMAKAHALTARQLFADVVGMLNVRVADQTVFAGAATDRAAMAPAETILADLDALVTPDMTAAQVIDAVENYFSGPTFAAAYTGSATPLSPVDIGDNRRIDYGVKADAEEFVKTLQATALAAVLAGKTLDDPQAQLDVYAEAGTQMLAAKDAILELSARVGIHQNSIERAKAQRVSERETLDMARAKIVSVDPLVAVSTYQQLEVQLESIYTVTARLSNLRFTNFMR